MGVAGIDLRDVVRMFAVPAYSVAILRPTGPGQMINGRFEEAARTSIPLRFASVQPFTASQRQMLPEGMREADTRHIFCIDQVNPVKRAVQLESDMISYKGFQWEIIELYDWNENANFWHIGVARIGQ